MERIIEEAKKKPQCERLTVHDSNWMPKKFGVNDKKAEAREREAAAKSQKKAAEQKAKEDAQWGESRRV